MQNKWISILWAAAIIVQREKKKKRSRPESRDKDFESDWKRSFKLK